VVLSNSGSRGGNISASVPSKYNSGSLAIELFTCKKQTVGAGGIIDALIDGGSPRVYYPMGETNFLC
jgi:hypothetical protein